MPLSPIFLNRLNRAHDFSRRRLEPFRRKRLSCLKQFVGMHYSEGGAEYAVPLNMIKLACQIYVRQLIARSPQTMVSSKNFQAKPTAMGMEAWVNQQIKEQEVAKSLRLAALDAIFCMGILKVGLCAGGQVEYDNQVHTYGFPFVDVIDLDDWVHDMNVKRWDQISFAGHRFSMPIELAKANESYDAQARNELTATYLSRTNESGDERVETLTHSVQAGNDFEEKVELWESWHPREQIIITRQAYPDGSLSTKPLKIVEWSGPKKGPFHRLSFGDVPGQTMPSAPVHDQLDMHDLINRIMVKCGGQAERQKTILGVQGTADADGKRIIEANDGEGIRMDFPDGTREFRFGGVDQQNMAFLIQCKGLFGYIAGNIDAIGGLAPGAETLGQDQMLTANASKTIQSMQEDMIAFTKSVVGLDGLAWYYLADPLQTYHTEVEFPPNNPIGKIEMQVTPEMRQMSKGKLEFDIDPYSLQHLSPQQQLQAMMGLCNNLLFPAMPMMAQQGMGVKFEGIIRDYCKFSGLRSPETYVMFSEELAMMQQGGGGQQAAPTGGKPNGNYTRTNRTSPESAETQMMTAMIQNQGGQG